MSEQPPERQRTAGKFITMDAAMLAAQNERLDRLNDNIQALAQSIAERPTKYDLKQARKRSRNQLLATILVFAFVTGGVVYNLDRLDDQCEDRNRNAAAFQALLFVLISQAEQTPEETPVEKAIKDYADTLKEIDC